MMRRLSIVFLSLFLLVPLCSQQAFAASTTMGFVPQSGSFGKPFTVDLVIDGHGDKFNASQATVKIPANLTVQDLVLGDCNFSFLHTPTIQNPSYAGVIVSSSSTKCTVYTLTLVPVEKGDATIALSQATVKRYGDAAEVLSSSSKGSYVLTNAFKSPSTSGKQEKNTSKNGLYTVYLKVVSKEKKSTTGITVILNPVSKKNPQQTVTDNTGTVHFSNLQTGIYDAVVKDGMNKVGETIINVSGKNHVLTLSINLEAQKNNQLMKSRSILTTIATNPVLLVIALVIGVVVGVVGALLIGKLIGKRKKK